MCRVSSSVYYSMFTPDEKFKFVYQQVGGHVLLDVLEYEECFDMGGSYYDYLPVCGTTHKNTACVLGKIDLFKIPMSVKRELRMFVQDCIIRANYERMCV